MPVAQLESSTDVAAQAQRFIVAGGAKQLGLAQADVEGLLQPLVVAASRYDNGPRSSYTDALLCIPPQVLGLSHQLSMLLGPKKSKSKGSIELPFCLYQSLVQQMAIERPTLPYLLLQIMPSSTPDMASFMEHAQMFVERDGRGRYHLLPHEIVAYALYGQCCFFCQLPALMVSSRTCGCSEQHALVLESGCPEGGNGWAVVPWRHLDYHYQGDRRRVLLPFAGGYTDRAGRRLTKVTHH